MDRLNNAWLQSRGPPAGSLVRARIISYSIIVGAGFASCLLSILTPRWHAVEPVIYVPHA